MTSNAPEIISPRVSKAFTALGESCKQAAEALGNALWAAMSFAVAVLEEMDIAQLLKAAEEMDIAQLLKAAKVQAALNEAPPKVRHLAEHGKKYRTRKKNINRALKDYERKRR